MGSRQMLTRAVGIEDPQADRLDAPLVPNRAHVVFRRQLRNCIR